MPYTEEGKFLIFRDCEGNLRVVVQAYFFGCKNYEYMVGLNVDRSFTTGRAWVGDMTDANGERLGYRNTDIDEVKEIAKELVRIGNSCITFEKPSLQFMKDIIISNGRWMHK